MKPSFAKIKADFCNDTLRFNLTLGDEHHSHQKKLHHDGTSNLNFTFWESLVSLKPVFFQMPFDKLEIEYTEDVIKNTGNIVELVSNILNHTNDAVIRHKHLKGMAGQNKRILLFNVDHAFNYRVLYDHFRDADEENLLYLNMSSGFNSTTRKWEKAGLPFPLSDFIDFIASEGVGKIVSINHHLLDRYLKDISIYLPCLFLYLGVEYVIIDHDALDAEPDSCGYLMKSFYHCPSFKRFSLGSVLQEYWDNRYNLNNIHYVAVPQSYNTHNSGVMNDLLEDYGVLILSNSRLASIRPMIGHIIFLLDQFQEKDVFTELQLWYCSLRHMILNVMDLNEYERTRYNGFIHILFYSAAQFLKYEIIENLSTDRKVEIYGDQDWQLLFPEYYQHKFLDSEGQDALFHQHRHLYLLLNYAITYLDGSGAIYEAISREVPFINYPALVKSKTFEGLKHIEYSNFEELNYRIENIRAVIKNEELKNSIICYKDVLMKSTKGIVRQVVFNEDSPAEESLFEQHRKDHEVILEQMIEEYIGQHETLLQETFNIFCGGDSIKYNISKSAYKSRRYVQNIIKTMKEG